MFPSAWLSELGARGGPSWPAAWSARAISPSRDGGRPYSPQRDSIGPSSRGMGPWASLMVFLTASNIGEVVPRLLRA